MPLIVEEAESSFGAPVPDLPGCIAVADTKEEVLDLIQEAIEFHIEGLRADGQAVPEPAPALNMSKYAPHNALAADALLACLSCEA